MISRYRDAWTQTLTEALTKRQLFWMRGPLKPHIVVLPTSRERLGAWTLFGTIYLSKGQLSCPAHVRNYIIGHELGHILNGDVFLQLLFAGSYFVMIATAGTGTAVQLFGIIISALSLLMYALPSLALEREMRADRVAVQLYGPQIVLDGSLWMARRTNDLHNPERVARLKRLREYVRESGD
jgi:Zn-dependent protease with chaperone function